MKTYNNYIILNPYDESSDEFFAQYPKGDDMRLRLMCAAPEGSFFFFPKEHQICTMIDFYNGHPMAGYSPAFSTIEEAQIAIDKWAPIDQRQKAECQAFLTDCGIDLPGGFGRVSRQYLSSRGRQC